MAELVAGSTGGLSVWSSDSDDRLAALQSIAAAQRLFPESPDPLKVGALLLLASHGEWSEGVNQVEEPYTKLTYQILDTDLVVTRMEVGEGADRETSLLVQDGDESVFHVGQSDPLNVDALPLEHVLEHLSSEQVALLQQYLAPQPVQSVSLASFPDRVGVAIKYLQTSQTSGEGFDALLDGHQQVLHEALYDQFVSLTGIEPRSTPETQTATYNSELYTVLVEADTEARLCTVLDQQDAIVFQAYDGVFSDTHPNCGFGLVECSLDNASILEVASAYLSKPDTNKTGIESVAAELKRLGELAPAGSKALIVAETVLRTHATDAKSGEVYSFARTDGGGLSVRDLATQQELVSLSPQGTVSPATLSATDRSLFSAMYSKLQQVAAQPTVAPLAKPRTADLER